MQKSKWSTEMNSFRAAYNGIKLAVLTERHMLLHGLAFGTVLLLGWWLRCTLLEMAMLVLVSALVIVAELINTAIEKMCDLVQPAPDPMVGQIKDIAAGAVLIAACAALIVGVLIFSPKIF